MRTLMRFGISVVGFFGLFSATSSVAFADQISDQLIVQRAGVADQDLIIMESDELLGGGKASVSTSFLAFDGTYCIQASCADGQSNVSLVEPGAKGISDTIIASIAFSSTDAFGRTIDQITLTMISFEDFFDSPSDKGEVSDVTANLFTTSPAGFKVTAISIEPTPEPASLLLVASGLTGLWAAMPSIRRRRRSVN